MVSLVIWLESLKFLAAGVTVMDEGVDIITYTYLATKQILSHVGDTSQCLSVHHVICARFLVQVLME